MIKTLNHSWIIGLIVYLFLLTTPMNLTHFSGQYGIIDFIDEQKRVVKVLIDFFGRQTPAELSFDEIVL